MKYGMFLLAILSDSKIYGQSDKMSRNKSIIYGNEMVYIEGVLQNYLHFVFCNFSASNQYWFQNCSYFVS